MHVKHCSKPKRTFNCKQCGVDTLFKHSSTNQYCSHTCAQIASRVKKDQQYYKRKRAIANEAWQRYSTKQKLQTPYDADRKLIQQIYEDCPDGYEVDHIVPISKGGLHHQDNLQYLPWRDNRRKSNKLNWSPRHDSNVQPHAPKA